MKASREVTTVLIGGIARSGNSLLGNMLGNWEDALYLPVEVPLRKFSLGHRDQAGRVRAYVEGLADQLDRGALGPSSLGETHGVRGFHGDVFRSAFFEALGSSVRAASVLRAFVHAMRECREEARTAWIAVVESPGSESLFGDLLETDEDLYCIHMIRPLLDVYASAKAKYLQTYYPSLRHPDNLLRQVVVQWRESVGQALLNVETLGSDRVQVVGFDEAKVNSDSFRERLAEFVFPSVGESRSLLRSHLDALASGKDVLRSRFVVAQNRSPVRFGDGSRYSHLARWEMDLCRLYDSWYHRIPSLGGRTAVPASVKRPSSGGRRPLHLMGLIARAAIAGPRLERRLFHVGHGLRLRRLGIEMVLDTARWMTRQRHEGQRLTALPLRESAVSAGSRRARA